MRPAIATLLLILISTTACQKESFIVVEKDDFLSFLESQPRPTDPKDLLDLYFYDYLGNSTPPMAKQVYEFSKEGEYHGISARFTQRDDSVSEVKYTIVYSKGNGEIELIEIRRSLRCAKGRGHENFSAEKCL